MKPSMVDTAWRISTAGLGVLWLWGSGCDASSGGTTVTFYVPDMGQRLKLL